MSAIEMRRLRGTVKLTQAQMAGLMGFSCRGYQELEEEKASFAPRHLANLERISLKLAVERCDPALAMPAIRQDAIRLARLFVGLDPQPLDLQPLDLQPGAQRGKPGAGG